MILKNYVLFCFLNLLFCRCCTKSASYEYNNKSATNGAQLCYYNVSYINQYAHKSPKTPHAFWFATTIVHGWWWNPDIIVNTNNVIYARCIFQSIVRGIEIKRLDIKASMPLNSHWHVLHLPIRWYYQYVQYLSCILHDPAGQVQWLPWIADINIRGFRSH